MEKKNDKLTAIIIGLSLLVILVITSVITSSSNSEEVTEASSTSTSQTSSTSSSTYSSSSSSSASSSTSSSTTASSSYATWSNLDDEGAKNYQKYYVEQLNNTLYASGSNDQVSEGYVSKEIMTVIVPQEYKYYSDNELQQLVDSLLNLKYSFFKQWAEENHYYSDSDTPYLYVETPDGATIAQESVWDNTMKLK
ncbi:hypothetical protein SAMN04487839_101484 [Streptococcus gallolyticus]|uniref:Uncharacterized protein n=1 Tax=Streptococcus gallolyticus TaxID=315405 RepID=A0A1H7UIV9_9STRE|nr:hypothetical protein [Streptococcus gallolyticus]SEF19240.1 hypothetical protein SAMN02910295_0432 [Streptococcus gallolyticus]SEL96716.1 hypothetical protein SAMN04487839_101484 [Streptococcus gallolyticus]